MKVRFKNYVILLILIAIGIGAAAGIMIRRNGIEAQNRSYDIVVDFADYAIMSYQSAYSTAEWMEMLAESGIKKVALFETSVEALAQNPTTEVQLLFGKEVMCALNWQEAYPEPVVEWVKSSTSAKDILVVCYDEEEFRWIVDAYERRVDGLEYEICNENGVGYLWLTGCKSGLSGTTLASMSLGLWPEQVKMIEAAGMQVIPRTKTIDGLNGAAFAEDVYQGFLPYASPYFMNSGDSLVGYDDPKWAAKLTDYLKATDGAFVVTEMMTEIGNVQWPETLTFVEASDCHAIRAFNEWEFVQKRYALYGYDGPQEIVNSLYRAIYERNCHLIVLNAIVDPSTKEDAMEQEYITDPAAYERLVSGIHQRMEQYGFTCETVAPAEAFHPHRIAYFLLGLAEVAAAILLLELFVPLKKKVRYLFLILGLICVGGALFLMPNTSKILLSLGGGIVMPCIAAMGALRYLNGMRGRWSDELGHACGSFGRMLPELLGVTIVLFLISFVGALFVSAPLSESIYFLEMRMYRGVKFMQLIPLLVFLVGYLQIHIFERYVFRPIPGEASLGLKDRRAKRKEAWNRFMERPVKLRGVWYGAIALVVLAVIGLIGVYYILRTGNTDASAVSASEMQFRNLLEELFVARPRMKEYLLGYPCMMLLGWSIYRRVPALSLVFGAGAVIGFTSIVNTFLHIRTMVAISFSRVFIGFGLGLVIGICAVAVAELLLLFVKSLKKRFA